VIRQAGLGAGRREHNSTRMERANHGGWVRLCIWHAGQGADLEQEHSIFEEKRARITT
jgi:hypothetical protein